VAARPSAGGASELAGAGTWHLAQTPHDAQLAELEFALLQVKEAFQRWNVQASRLVSDLDLGFGEVVILHVVRMQERAKDAATIANLVNRDDLPNVQYSLRKLADLGLVEKTRVGSGTFYSVTADGTKITDRYAELRQHLLTSTLAEIDHSEEKLRRATRFMQLMTGIYDGASRTSATVNPTLFFRAASDEPAPTAGTARTAARARGTQPGAKKRSTPKTPSQ
jgi:predicted MarR family transcription regulator